MGEEIGSLTEGAPRAMGKVGLHEPGGVSLGGAAPEPPEFSALEESGGIGTRKAEPIKLCHAVIHPPRRSGCSKAKPCLPGGQEEYTMNH
jgi:hypothetical protein